MGVKLDGRDPREFGLIFLKDHFHPHTPEMRTKTLIIPGRPGAWDFGSEWDIRRFSLPFAIIKTNRLEMQRKVRAFVAFLLDSYGRPREVKLTFDYEPDKYYSVKLASQISPERFFFAEQFELPLVAYDPYAKFVVDSDEITLGSDIPLSSNITLGSVSSFNVSVTDNNTHVFYVYNEGLITLSPKIIIIGSAAEFAMSSSGGKSFTLTPFSNKTIEIDGENYTVKEDGQNNLAKMNATGFLQLAPGKNTITVRGTGVDVNITFKFKYKFI